MRNSLLQKRSSEELPPLQFVKAPQDRGADYVLIYVNTNMLDEAWSRDGEFYIPRDGQSAIGNRRERFQEWLKNNPNTPIESPSVGWNGQRVSFTNGRHRFSVLRDMGYPNVAVTIHKSQLKDFKPMMATSKTAASVSYPDTLNGLAAEAKKCPTFKDFQSDFLLQIKHGQYWHVTRDPNFKIDPNKGPRDMSSMADGVAQVGKLMITSHLEYWDAHYNFPDDERVNSREYAALIDMSRVPREEYGQVNRGFGNEFWVEDPSQAKVIKVIPVEQALAESDKFNRVLSQYINCLRQLKEFWQWATGNKVEEEKPIERCSSCRCPVGAHNEDGTCRNADSAYGNCGCAGLNKTASATPVSIADIYKIVDEFMSVLAPGLPKPEIKLSNGQSDTLGECLWRFGSKKEGGDWCDDSTVITLQKRICGDERTLRRVVAHEMAHHEDFLVNDAEEFKEKGFDKYQAWREIVRHNHHGAKWVAIAARFNAKYGENFVTQTSDQDFVIDNSNLKPCYVLIEKYYDGSLMWQVANRLSPKARKYLAELAEGEYLGSSSKGRYEHKLFMSSDPTLLKKGAPLVQYNGWAVAKRNEGAQERLEELWNNGQDILSQFKPTPSENKKQSSQGRVAAPISEGMKSQIYYHGTGSEASAQAILKDGIQPRDIIMPDKAKSRAQLSPVPNRVYLTTSKGYASIYALGGQMFGAGLYDQSNTNYTADQWLKNNTKDGAYGYIFEIHGNQLTGDVVPDEDSIGEALEWLARDIKDSRRLNNLTGTNSETGQTNYYPPEKEKWVGELDSLKRSVEFNKQQRINQPDVPQQVRTELYHLYLHNTTDRQKQNMMEIGTQAQVGKKLQKLLSQETCQWMIENGAHVAHRGAIIPTRCQRFSKEKALYTLNLGEILEDVPMIKTASPDFGYSEFNNREKDLKKVRFVSQGYEKRFGGEGDLGVAAKYEGKDIGHIKCWVVRRLCTVYGVEIEGDWRGTGLGQMLYDAAIQVAKKAGCAVFSYDSQLSIDAINAWERIKNRYPVYEEENGNTEEETEVHPVIYRIDLDRVPGKVGSTAQIMEKNEKFNELATAQRNEPEDAMLRCQYHPLGSGVHTLALEHVGDLTHRMSENFAYLQGQYGNVKDKVEKTLYWLNSSYGFRREMFENMEKNYEFWEKTKPEKLNGKPYNELELEFLKLWDAYSAAHSKLRVFNYPQRLAREAAVQLGKRNFSGAVSNLERLKKMLEGGAQVWAQLAGEYKPAKTAAVASLHFQPLSFEDFCGEQGLNQYKGDIQKRYEYEDNVAHFSTVDFPITLYRALELPKGQPINFDKMGAFWSWVEDSADAYFGNSSMWSESYGDDDDEEGELVIIKAQVMKPQDVDWEKTLLANTVNPEENEINIKPGAELKLIGVSRGSDPEWLPPEENFKTVVASHKTPALSTTRFPNMDGTDGEGSTAYSLLPEYVEGANVEIGIDTLLGTEPKGEAHPTPGFKAAGAVEDKLSTTKLKDFMMDDVVEPTSTFIWSVDKVKKTATQNMFGKWWVTPTGDFVPARGAKGTRFEHWNGGIHDATVFGFKDKGSLKKNNWVSAETAARQAGYVRVVIEPKGAYLQFADRSQVEKMAGGIIRQIPVTVPEVEIDWDTPAYGHLRLPLTEAEEKFQKTGSKKYGSVQIDLPHVDFHVDEEDLMGDGIENEAHVTVRYGIENDNIEGIKELLSLVEPFTLTFGKTGCFPPSPSSDGAAVLVVHIESPELHEINAELAEVADWKKSDFDEYRPHMTLAYVKPGTEDKYVGDSLEGKEYTVTQITISDSNKNRYVVKLRGATRGVTAAAASSVLPNSFEQFCNQNGGFEKIFSEVADMGSGDWDQYTMFYDQDEQEAFDALSDEEKEKSMWQRAYTDWEQRYDELQWQHTSWDWPLKVWRCVSLKNIQSLKTKGVGVFWSYEESAAHAHWGTSSNHYVLEAQVTENDVDWEGTIWANLHPSCGEDEKELRLNEGAQIQILRYKDPNRVWHTPSAAWKKVTAAVKYPPRYSIPNKQPSGSFSFKWLWSEKSGTIIFRHTLPDGSTSTHVDMAYENGLPAYSREFDRLPRGTGTLNPTRKAIQVTSYSGGEDVYDLENTIKEKFNIPDWKFEYTQLHMAAKYSNPLLQKKNSAAGDHNNYVPRENTDTPALHTEPLFEEEAFDALLPDHKIGSTPRSKYDKVCYAIATDDKLWDFLCSWTTNSDAWDEYPEEGRKMVSLIASLPPITKKLYRGEEIWREQPDWENFRPMLSFSLNYDTAKTFAERRGVVWETVGKVQGVALSDIVTWRNRTHPRESNYSGAQAEWFVLSNCKVKECQPTKEQEDIYNRRRYGNVSDHKVAHKRAAWNGWEYDNGWRPASEVQVGDTLTMPGTIMEVKRIIRDGDELLIEGTKPGQFRRFAPEDSVNLMRRKTAAPDFGRYQIALKTKKKKASFDKTVNVKWVPGKGWRETGTIRLYRGMEQPFDENFDHTKTDAPEGYSTWTDNPELAKQYAGTEGHIYQMDLPKHELDKKLVDERGNRSLFVKNEKGCGLNGVAGNEYLVYLYHDSYSPSLVKTAAAEGHDKKPTDRFVTKIDGKRQKRFSKLKVEAIMEDSAYYMEEGCGIYAMALVRQYPDAKIYILSRNGGEAWSESIPYEVTHVFCRVPTRGMQPLNLDVKGDRTPDQMADDFGMVGNYSIKGPFTPQEFYAKFMGNSGNKPLYGTVKDIKEVIVKTADPTQIKSAIGNSGKFDPKDKRITAAASPSKTAKTVYHGTAFSFSEFDTDRIGEGEGNQSYGWGLYFTSSREIAEQYRQTLAGEDCVWGLDGKPVDFKAMDTLQQLAFRIIGQPNLYGKALDSLVDDQNISQENIDTIASFVKEYQGRVSYTEHPKGNIYAATIPEDDVMLLWDELLTQQPPKVREALINLPKYDSYYTGGQLYDALSKELVSKGGAKHVSQLMHSYGIAGIKYLDGNSRSRSEGAGTYNYVIFSNKDVRNVKTASPDFGYSHKIATKVYHGTPHSFDSFDTDHIGEGEGAQVYGWGIYFTDSKDVADYYRQSTVGTLFPPQPRQFTLDGVAYAREGDTFSKGSGGEIKKVEYARAFVKAQEAYYHDVKTKGNLYAADIPEYDTMILWDKTLKYQPESVQQLWNEHWATKEADGIFKDPDGSIEPDVTGKLIYEHFAGEEGSAKAASLFLRGKGVSGIKYLDGQSRSMGEGTHNYVIFDSRDVIKTASAAVNKTSPDLGKAVKQFCASNESYTILDSLIPSGATWLAGGCWILAYALCEGFNGDLYGVFAHGIPQHAVAKIGGQFIDGDGASTAAQLLKRWKAVEGLPPETYLAPVNPDVVFAADKEMVAPPEEGRKEIIESIKRIMNPKGMTPKGIVASGLTPTVEAWHGTPKKFNKFELNNGVIWFADDEEVAVMHGRDDEATKKTINIYHVKLQMNNPYQGDGDTDPDDPEVVSFLKSQGYDSIILPDYTAGEDYVVFDPAQVTILDVKTVPAWSKTGTLDKLYHGTAVERVPSIMKEGLKGTEGWPCYAAKNKKTAIWYALHTLFNVHPEVVPWNNPKYDKKKLEDSEIAVITIEPSAMKHVVDGVDICTNPGTISPEYLGVEIIRVGDVLDVDKLPDMVDPQGNRIASKIAATLPKTAYSPRVWYHGTTTLRFNKIVESGYLNPSLADDKEFGEAIWFTSKIEEARAFGPKILCIAHQDLMRFKHKNICHANQFSKEYKEFLRSLPEKREFNMLVFEPIPIKYLRIIEGKNIPSHADLGGVGTGATKVTPDQMQKIKRTAATLPRNYVAPEFLLPVIKWLYTPELGVILCTEYAENGQFCRHENIAKVNGLPTVGYLWDNIDKGYVYNMPRSKVCRITGGATEDSPALSEVAYTMMLKFPELEKWTVIDRTGNKYNEPPAKEKFASEVLEQEPEIARDEPATESGWSPTQEFNNYLKMNPMERAEFCKTLTEEELKQLSDQLSRHRNQQNTNKGVPEEVTSPKAPKSKSPNPFTYTPPEENKSFQRWFGKSKVVGYGGEPLVVYHGTTHEFDVFKDDKGNPENFYGKGHYFTSSREDTENYAGMGPDLTSRVENQAERLVQNWEYDDDFPLPDDFRLADGSVIPGWEDMDNEERVEAYKELDWDDQLAAAKREVKKEIVGEHGGAVMPCYLRIVKPVIVARRGGTYFDIHYNRGGDPAGKLFDAVERTLMYTGTDPYKFWYDVASDNPDGFTAYEFEVAVRHSETMMNDDVLNEGGPGPIIAAIYREMGFDGIIMENPKDEFSNMKMDDDTRHYIVWNANQIKSALGNSGKFDKKNPVITAGKTAMPKLQENRRVQVYYHGTMSEARAKSIMQKGLIPNFHSNYFGGDATSKGYAYVTTDLRVALQHATQVGRDKDPRYLFVINGNELVENSLPDEDYVGEEAFKAWMSVYGNGMYKGTPTLVNFVKEFVAKNPKVNFEKLTSGDLGKRLIQAMPEELVAELLQASPSLAHAGVIKPYECWQFALERCRWIDGWRRRDITPENFFQKAQKIWSSETHKAAASAGIPTYEQFLGAVGGADKLFDFLSDDCGLSNLEEFLGECPIEGGDNNFDEVWDWYKNKAISEWIPARFEAVCGDLRTLQFPLTVYRAVELPAGIESLNVNKLGIYWSSEESGAEPHWHDEEGEGITLRAVIPITAVNWVQTIKARIHPFTGDRESEITLKRVQLQNAAYHDESTGSWIPLQMSKTAATIGPVYHGTAKDFQDFELTEGKRTFFGLAQIEVKSGAFFFTDDPNKARNWAENRRDKREPLFVWECYLTMNQTLDLTKPDWPETEVPYVLLPFEGVPRGELLSVLRDMTAGQLNEADWHEMGIDINQLRVFNNEWLFLMVDSPEIIAALKHLKYDSIIMDEGEDPELGGISYAVFNKNQINKVKRRKVGSKYAEGAKSQKQKMTAAALSWQEILSQFPEQFQKEITSERTGTPEDIQELSGWRLLSPEPIEVPLKSLIVKSRTVLQQLPEALIDKINKKWTLHITPSVVYDQNPGRYEQYASMSVNTARPSTMLDGEIVWGVGRFIAALLRGDSTLKVWNITQKQKMTAATNQIQKMSAAKYTCPSAFYIEVPKDARGHFWGDE